MIPSIVNQFTTEQQQSTVGYRLTSLYNDLSQLESLFFGDCPTTKDITDQIPKWILIEKEALEDQGSPSVTIFDLLQKYYDWLYCDTKEGSEFQLGLKLLDLIDVDKTKDAFVERLAQIYAHGLEPSALNINGGKISVEDTRNFIHNIRKNFYHKKTTIDGIRYFFRTLFNISEESIKVEYPKKYLLRLNGGRFYSDNFSFPGGTGSYDVLQNLSGSCLNFSRMQDGNFFQDFSYLLKTGIKSSYYKDTYKTMAHPAGLRVMYEKTLEDYSGPNVDYDTYQVCERPYIRNYTPYRFAFEYTDVIGSCGGTTYYGLNSCIGCCGTSFGSLAAPTFAFPNWNGINPQFTFKTVQLKDFFNICYDQGEISSPNIGLTCANCT